MHEAGTRRRLADEPCAIVLEILTIDELGYLHELDGDETIQLRVERTIDAAHPTFADRR